MVSPLLPLDGMSVLGAVNFETCPTCRNHCSVLPQGTWRQMVRNEWITDS